LAADITTVDEAREMIRQLAEQAAIRDLTAIEFDGVKEKLLPIYDATSTMACSACGDAETFQQSKLCSDCFAAKQQAAAEIAAAKAAERRKNKQAKVAQQTQVAAAKAVEKKKAKAEPKYVRVYSLDLMMNLGEVRLDHNNQPTDEERVQALAARLVQLEICDTAQAAEVAPLFIGFITVKSEATDRALARIREDREAATRRLRGRMGLPEVEVVEREEQLKWNGENEIAKQKRFQASKPSYHAWSPEELAALKTSSRRATAWNRATRLVATSTTPTAASRTTTGTDEFWNEPHTGTTGASGSLLPTRKVGRS
jgi:hypothetical protein